MPQHNAAFFAFLQENESLVRAYLGANALRVNFYFDHGTNTRFEAIRHDAYGEAPLGQGMDASIVRSAHATLDLHARWPVFVAQLEQFVQTLFADSPSCTELGYNLSASLSRAAINREQPIVWANVLFIREKNVPILHEGPITGPNSFQDTLDAIEVHVNPQATHKDKNPERLFALLMQNEPYAHILLGQNATRMRITFTPHEDGIAIHNTLAYAGPTVLGDMLSNAIGHTSDQLDRLLAPWTNYWQTTNRLVRELFHHATHPLSLQRPQHRAFTLLLDLDRDPHGLLTWTIRAHQQSRTSLAAAFFESAITHPDDLRACVQATRKQLASIT